MVREIVRRISMLEKLNKCVFIVSEMYCDQFGGMSDEEHARQQSFRKRKKRYRNWDEVS